LPSRWSPRHWKDFRQGLLFLAVPAEIIHFLTIAVIKLQLRGRTFDAGRRHEDGIV
jgi:hypothetical protein